MNLFKVTLVFSLVAWPVLCHAEGAPVKEFKGGVVFNHSSHQSERVGKCFVCHDNVTTNKDGKTSTMTKPGRIKGFGKEWAHKYCTDCHDLFGEGPVECKDCHQK